MDAGTKPNHRADQTPDLPSLGRSIFEGSPLPMAAVAGANHIVQYVNPAFCRLVGKSKDELIGIPFAEIMPGDGCLSLLDRIYRTGEAETYTELEHSEAHPVYWSYAMWPVLAAEERPVGILIQVTETTRFHQQATAMNQELLLSAVRQHELMEAAERLNAQLQLEITEHAKAEDALRSSEAKMHGIVGSAMDAIISVDEQQRIVVFNRAAEKVFGCPAAEAIDHPLDRFIPAQFREAHRRHVQAFASSGTTSRSAHSPGILSGLRANGEEFPMEATISQVTVGGERLYTVILRDITERKRAEEALLRSEKLASAGRLAATIAHEINNPLAAVTNSLFLARTAENLPESVRQYLETADEELKRVAHITRQSLGFYRESNSPAFTSVTAVLDSAVDLLRSKIKTKQVVIEKQWDGDVEVSAVSGELRQVFSNLLTNSLDAIEEKGTIKLRVSTGAAFNNGHPCVRVTVADNGKGIDASLRRHLFEPFFTTKGTVGTGLGLWVSKQIIDKHGGTIRMRSSSDGARRGTVFSIFLPTDPHSIPQRNGPEINQQ
jgi:PAS domain S-box-containing protein